MKFHRQSCTMMKTRSSCCTTFKLKFYNFSPKNPKNAPSANVRNKCSKISKMN
jgi:hypothetical protein